jgi:hypothetical protein
MAKKSQKKRIAPREPRQEAPVKVDLDNLELSDTDQCTRIRHRWDLRL